MTTHHVLQSRAILDYPTSPTLIISVVLMLALTPMFADAILLLRVFVVYPPDRLSRNRCLVVYGPIILLKTARIVNFVLYTVRTVRVLTHTEGLIDQAAEDYAFGSPLVRTEWCLMLCDTS